jgi:hypothetical protein
MKVSKSRQDGFDRDQRRQKAAGTVSPHSANAKKPSGQFCQLTQTPKSRQDGFVR